MWVSSILIMRYISILYIFFLSLLAGGNLQNILKEADKICTVYDFDAGAVLSNDKAFANIGQLKKVAEELSAKGFPYDAQNDTLVLRIHCTDYLVGTYRSTFGRTSYYPLPVSIDAYSTKGECHLKLKHSEYEAANPSADLLVPLIKANDIAAIADLHKKYGADALGAVPDDYIVIIIQGGKAISASRWSLSRSAQPGPKMAKMVLASESQHSGKTKIPE